MAQNPEYVTGAQKPMETQKAVDTTGVIDPNGLVFCAGACCSNNFLYTDFPACCGVHETFECLIVRAECMCCKPSEAKDAICLCNQGLLEIVYPTTCCKRKGQTMCLYGTCAFPCDDEVPCTCGTLGMMCCYKSSFKFACCEVWSNIIQE